jgi:hypothetical protein
MLGSVRLSEMDYKSLFAPKLIARDHISYLDMCVNTIYRRTKIGKIHGMRSLKDPHEIASGQMAVASKCGE